MANMRKQNLELYVHIPFCVKKCAYCDFLSGPSSEEDRQEYVDALICEIRQYKGRFDHDTVTSVFLGGGTPSILKEEQIVAVFLALREAFNIRPEAEITIEMNPGTVTRKKLHIYRKVGINRISIGLQSTDDAELKLLGRIHTYSEFLQTYQMAREAGFENVNIDIISAIPGQTIASFKNTLENVIALNPEHISAYSLIVEEGTPFYEMYGPQSTSVTEGETDGQQRLPDEEEEREIYAMTKELLKNAGYHRYEISNYAREGYECRHNLGYWNRTDYLGIGLGASSLIQNRRFRHIEDRKMYCEVLSSGCQKLEMIEEDTEGLSRQAQMEEFMFLGLRKMEGVSAREFYQEFGIEIEAVYWQVINRLIKEKLMERNMDRLSLTDRGIDISNCVLSEFLL